MKRKLLPLLAVLAISALFMFAACGDNNSTHTHSFGAWEREKSATCIEYGSEVRKCSCGEKETRKIDPTFEHDYDEDGVCYDCESIQGTEGLTYTYNESIDAYELTAVPATLTDVVVDNVYDDDEHGANFVKGIAAGAFKAATPDNNTALKKVTVNQKIEYIGGGAFYNCTALAEIVLPDTVNSIGANAFYNCSSLKAIELPELVTEIKANTFYKCSLLAAVDFSGVTSIGGSAFVNCIGLKTVNLPKATSLGSSAFYGCLMMTDATIPEVTKLLPYTFYNCASLTTAKFNAPKLTAANVGENALYGTQVSIGA